MRSSTGPSGSKHKFCGALGHPSEDAVGLVYMRARWMDPATGRFVSQDPSGFRKNWFVYASSNPVNRVDPSGLLDGTTTALRSELDWDLAAVGALSSALAGVMVAIIGYQAVQSGLASVLFAEPIKGLDRLGQLLGQSAREVGRAIERVKQGGSGRGSPIRNPDVMVDPETGEVYPELPDGTPAEDSIGNIFDDGGLREPGD